MEGIKLDENVLEVSLANELREIAGVAEKIDAFCEAHALSREIAYSVNLSIDEILTNTINYGYQDDDPHRIELVVRFESDSLSVVIVDDSRPFDLTVAPEPDVEASLDEREVGGLGLFLVHQMMDKVDHELVDGRNVVTLTKSTVASD